MGSAQSIAARKVRPAALARELGVTRQSIHELVQRGVVAADANGLIDADLARLALVDRLRPSAKTAQAVASGVPDTEAAAAAAPIGNYHVARTLRETAEARLAQLTLAERQGRLLDAAAVERSTFEFHRALRDRLTGIPDRTAPIVAAEPDVAKCHAILAEEIRTVLGDIVKSLEEAA